MDWTTLKQVIRCNAPHPQHIHFIKHDNTPPDILSIFDLGQLRRKGLIHTGHLYVDEMREAQVCNAAWFNGEIPEWGWKGDKPARGWHQTLELLLAAGTLRPSRELDDLLHADSRGICAEDMRMMYVP